MFIIYEHNGDYCMGEMMNYMGEVEKFDTREEAERYAKEECAFEYKIIEI
jgi:hypothetical protein